jgi:Coenzyme PQQ synthesis protein D (PqqD)
MTEKFISRGPALAYRMLGGETIVMSAGDSTLFSLDEVASLIWQLADGRTPLTAIVDRICQEYDVDHATARNDAEEFIAVLASRGLLTVSEQPCAETPSEVTKCA